MDSLVKRTGDKDALDVKEYGQEAACKVSFEEILDIQLALYEAMMRHELSKKER